VKVCIVISSIWFATIDLPYTNFTFLNLIIWYLHLNKFFMTVFAPKWNWCFVLRLAWARLWLTICLLGLLWHGHVVKVAIWGIFLWLWSFHVFWKLRQWYVIFDVWGVYRVVSKHACFTYRFKLGCIWSATSTDEDVFLMSWWFGCVQNGQVVVAASYDASANLWCLSTHGTEPFLLRNVSALVFSNWR